MKAVLVANPKGGCGKTTVAINLAGALAARGDRVYLWDLDRQKSALEWLSLRPTTLPGIRRLDARMPNDDAVDGKPVWMVLDSPAALHGKNLGHALKAAHKVLVPLQPSLFDMAATRDFVRVLSEEKAVRRHRTSVGIVGVRVDPRTKAAATLSAFLAQYELPVVAFLRDTQLYPNAAFTGRSLFDFPPSLVERDVEQWTRILDWIATVPAV
ncbi:MAG: ParA family protein [Burkholderiales bacterium]